MRRQRPWRQRNFGGKGEGGGVYFGYFGWFVFSLNMVLVLFLGLFGCLGVFHGAAAVFPCAQCPLASPVEAATSELRGRLCWKARAFQKTC